MHASRHIEFDLTTVYCHRAVADAQASLVQSHRAASADEFVAQHRQAIQRAARGRLNGLAELAARMALRELRLMCQAGNPCA